MGCDSAEDAGGDVLVRMVAGEGSFLYLFWSLPRECPNLQWPLYPLQTKHIIPIFGLGHWGGSSIFNPRTHAGLEVAICIRTVIVYNVLALLPLVSHGRGQEMLVRGRLNFPVSNRMARDAYTLTTRTKTVVRPRRSIISAALSIITWQACTPQYHLCERM